LLTPFAKKMSEVLDEEGVRFYLDVTGVPPGQITKALEQVAQEGTAIIYHKASTRLFTEAG
jgi:hypothetical protein